MEREIVLLIESDRDRLEKLRKLFESADRFRVETASDGREGLERARALRPQVIVLNIVLPYIDGATLLRKLDKEWNAVTTIMYAPYVSMRLLFMAKNAGVDYYFTMPYSSQALLASACSEEPSGLTTSCSALERATKLLHAIGMSPNLNGYPYVREALVLAGQDPLLTRAVTKELYPAIAKRYSTSPSCVERSIRTSIEYLWSHGDIEKLNGIFGAVVAPKRGKPTNREFLSVLLEQLRFPLDKRLR